MTLAHCDQTTCNTWEGSLIFNNIVAIQISEGVILYFVWSFSYKSTALIKLLRKKSKIDASTLMLTTSPQREACGGSVSKACSVVCILCVLCALRMAVGDCFVRGSRSPYDQQRELYVVQNGQFLVNTVGVKEVKSAYICHPLKNMKWRFLHTTY